MQEQQKGNLVENAIWRRRVGGGVGGGRKSGVLMRKFKAHPPTLLQGN